MTVKNDNEPIAKNIKRIISEKCLKQSAVAQRCGMTRQIFGHLLNGRKIIRAETIPHIASALGVDFNELFKN